MEKLEVLKRSDLFRDLNDEQLAEIEIMCTALEFDTGEILCKQGIVGGMIYVIETGLVGIMLEVGLMAKRQVQAAANFESFGWSAMIEPFTCTATVKALEKTKVYGFNGRELSDLCTTHSEIGCKLNRAVARVVAERLRQAYVQLLGCTYQE